MKRSAKKKPAKKAARGARAKRTGGRKWITLALFIGIGFFAYSIYLGLKSAPQTVEKETPRASSAILDLPKRAVPDYDSPTLLVLNGCGRDRLGTEAARWLRAQGFDVFETRNADRSDYERTVIVVRSRRTEAARKIQERLQRTLGIGFTIEQRARVPEADVLLILGRDFPDSLPVF